MLLLLVNILVAQTEKISDHNRIQIVEKNIYPVSSKGGVNDHN